MRVIAFILFILVFGVFSLSGQSSTSYDVEFSRICLIDSIAPDTLTQFWRFTQANNPGGITRDYTYDLAGGYNVSGTVVPCCSCLTAASDKATVEIPGAPGNNWGAVGFLAFLGLVVFAFIFLLYLAEMKAARFACTFFFLTLIPVSQGFAQSETLYDVEFSQICLIDSIAPDTIVQFWRFTHANNPGGITRDFTYDLSGAYIPTGTVIGCNDYYLGDNPEGSGTAGTLAIWTGTETLGNSSLTESAEEAAWDLTGALTVPTGTDAEVPVWGNGKLRYNTTGGGFQGGPSGYYLPWASVDNFTNTYIPYSDGTKLVQDANFKWTGGLNIGNVSGASANQPLHIRTAGSGVIARMYNSSNTNKLDINADGSLQFQNETAGQGVYFGSSSSLINNGPGSSPRIKWNFSNSGGNKSVGFTVTAFGNVAEIGGNNIGSTSTDVGIFISSGNSKISSYAQSVPLLLRGAQTSSGGGDVIIQGGNKESTNATPIIGNVYIRPGNQTSNGSSINAEGVPGKVFLQAYKDSTVTDVPGTIRTLITLYQENIELYHLSETPGEATDRILTMQDDTLKYRVFAYAEMSIDDANPDTISITSGTPAEGTDWTAGELANFTYSAGRLTYTGSETAKFLINTTVSFSFNVGNTVIEAWIYKNGAEVTKSELHRKIGTAGDVGNGGQTCILELATNDYIELFFDADNNGNVIIQNANVNLVKI